MRKWYRGESTQAPLWHFILESAGYDPLRAQQIEESVSQLWWERWFTDREARISAQKRPTSQSGAPRTAREVTTQRQRFTLDPDGRLHPGESA